MAREKTTGFYFKMSPQEHDSIRKGMEVVNIHNMSAYLRKMGANGYIINLDTPTITEIGRLTRILSNNANQIAARANSSGYVLPEDVAYMNKQLEEIRINYGRVLHELAKIQ